MLSSSISNQVKNHFLFLDDIAPSSVFLPYKATTAPYDVITISDSVGKLLQTPAPQLTIAPTSAVFNISTTAHSVSKDLASTQSIPMLKFINNDVSWPESDKDNVNLDGGNDAKNSISSGVAVASENARFSSKSHAV